MQDDERLTYPAIRPGRAEDILTKATIIVLVVLFTALGVYTIGVGIASGGVRAVSFGSFELVLVGVIGWSFVRVVSSIELAGDFITWRTAFRTSRAETASLRSIGYPDTTKVVFAFADGRRVTGRRRPGLEDFVAAIRAVHPRVAVDVNLEVRVELARRRRRPGGGGTLQRVLPVVGAVVVCLFIAQLGRSVIGTQKNYRTLSSDLAAVRLPAGYDLLSTSRKGTDCRNGPCELDQRWLWRDGAAHRATDACRDVRQALKDGLSDVASNSPRPEDALCDYFTILDGFFHPSRGKRTVEGMVLTGSGGAASPGGFVVRLTASYG